MKFTKATAKSGVFVLSAILIAIFLIYKINIVSLRKQCQYEVFFDHIDKLDMQSPVTYGGFQVGKVTDIRVNPKRTEENNFKALSITVLINEDVKLKTDSRVSIKTLGYMGEKYLDISIGTWERPNIRPGTSLIGEEPMDLNWIVEKIGNELSNILPRFEKIVNELENTVADINSLVHEVHDKRYVQGILEQSQSAAEKINTMAKDLEALVQNNSVRVDQTMETVLNMATELRQNLTDIYRRCQTVLDEGNHAVQKASSLMNHLDQLAIDSDAKIRTMTNDAVILVKNIKEFAMKINENPWLLLAKPRQKSGKNAKSRR